MARKFEKTFVPGQAADWDTNLTDAGLKEVETNKFASVNYDLKGFELIETAIDAKTFIASLSQNVEPDKGYFLGMSRFEEGEVVGGHAVALRLEGEAETGGPEKILFMDPNVGEVSFDMATEGEQFLEFMGQWWEVYRPMKFSIVTTIELGPDDA